LSFSRDESKIWPQTRSGLKGIVIDARTGASSPIGANDFLVFSPDGKRILRYLTAAVPGATKPHLPIAELLER